MCTDAKTQFGTDGPKHRFLSLVFLGTAAFIALSFFAEPAHAIPVFARKYQTSCMTCHAGFPKLNGAVRVNNFETVLEKNLVSIESFLFDSCWSFSGGV